MAINATVLNASINKLTNNLIATLQVTMPRIVLSEFNTHRMFSRNSSSSRAIPASKMIEVVEKNPFIPYAFQKAHSGMQGTSYHTDFDTITSLRRDWKVASKGVVYIAKELAEKQVSKQIINRLLEPFMWQTVIVTATEWENFFDLRCPSYGPEGSKNILDTDITIDDINDLNFSMLPTVAHSSNSSQADIHIQLVAEAMYNAIKKFEPTVLEPGEYHLPFGNKDKLPLEQAIKVNVAKAARVSYTRIDNQDRENEVSRDIDLYNNLLSSKHMSPFEHVAIAMTPDDLDNNLLIEDGKHQVGVSRNFRGFIQYRQMIQ